MGPEEGISEKSQKEYFMHLKSKRLETFTSWPFQEDCVCTPKRMADAGFYHCGNDKEPDYVQCFVCQKELDGWEPNDDPVKEHKQHSKDCKFLKMRKSTEDLTLDEFYKFIALICKTKAKKQLEDGLHELQTHAEGVKAKMEMLV